MECLYYSKGNNGTVRCNLCPHSCSIKPGEIGICSVRRNKDGILKSTNYGLASSISLDPIEKKPLYHFFPGSKILSIGSFGCNMKCSFCQNYNISQSDHINVTGKAQERSIESILQSAGSFSDNCGIAFTYNEPVVWYEFMSDIAKEAKEIGQKTVMVTNGYIKRLPLIELLPLIDAFNVDLKAFNNDFYKEYTGASLKPVLNSLQTIKSSGSHLEITMLIIDGANDKLKEFTSAVKWIAGNLGRETPLHLSRYFPRYKLDLPSTMHSTLTRFFSFARTQLDYVYLGNISESGYSDTICPACNTTVTVRSAYEIKHVNSGDLGECLVCGEIIYTNFIFRQ